MTAKNINPKISIIIPIYNVQENYFKRCIDSVLNQTYRNIEVILIDDCSTDTTGRLCDIIRKNDERVRVIHNRNNLGVAESRNRGLEIADADYVMFVDADDWIDKNTIEKIMSEIEKKEEKAELVRFPVTKEYLTHSEIIPSISRIWSSDKEKQDLVISTIGVALKSKKYVNIMTAAVWGALYSLKMLRENKIAFEKVVYREDTIFSIDAIENSNMVEEIPWGMYHYRCRASSVVNKYRENDPEDQLQMLEYVRARGYSYKMGEEFFSGVLALALVSMQMVITGYFYHKNNRKSIFIRHVECERYFQNEPYCSVFKHIKIRSLTKSFIVKAILIKIHLYGSVNTIRKIYLLMNRRRAFP